MNNVLLICDLLTCRSMANGHLSAWTEGETLFWLPESIYQQLTKSEKSSMKPFFASKQVKTIAYPDGFLAHYAKLQRLGISLTDYFVVRLMLRQGVDLLCSADWYQTVHTYFHLPAFERCAPPEETLRADRPVVSKPRLTARNLVPVLLITTSAKKNRYLETK